MTCFQVISQGVGNPLKFKRIPASRMRLGPKLRRYGSKEPTPEARAALKLWKQTEEAYMAWAKQCMWLMKNEIMENAIKEAPNYTKQADGLTWVVTATGEEERDELIIYMLELYKYWQDLRTARDVSKPLWKTFFEPLIATRVRLS